MIKIITEIFKALSLKQRKTFLLLQPLVVFMSCLEVLVIIYISVFIGLIADQESLIINDYYLFALSFMPNLSTSNFILLSALAALMLTTCSSILSIFTTWKLARFASVTGAELSVSLFNAYLSKNWIFHASENSSDLIKNITFQTQRFTGGVLNPLMQLSAKIAVTVGICVAIFIQNRVTSTIIICLLVSTYVILFLTVKRTLSKNGKFVTTSTSKRYRTASQALEGIRDVIMMNKRDYFIRRFRESSLGYARGTSNNIILISTPKYFIEWVALSVAMLAIIYFNHQASVEFEPIFSQIIFFILAGSKLIPAVQQIYTIVSSIKADISSFEVFQNISNEDARKQTDIQNGKFRFEKSIELNNVSFRYPAAKRAAIQNISITIDKNEIIGIVGPSGSGKSTLVDLIAGLIAPNTGTIKVDGIILGPSEIFSWRENIGYHSQATFVADSDFSQNIAFGCEKDEVDYKRVQEVIDLVNLSGVINQSENNIHEAVGEKGVNLSGGQLQRLGIARTLYSDPSLLILDEATAALDGSTEEKILDTINQLKRKKTLIMIAHRVTTLSSCDRIFVVEEGRLTAVCTYQELLKDSRYLKLANNMEHE